MTLYGHEEKLKMKIKMNNRGRGWLEWIVGNCVRMCVEHLLLPRSGLFLLYYQKPENDYRNDEKPFSVKIKIFLNKTKTQ